MYGTEGRRTSCRRYRGGNPSVEGLGTDFDGVRGQVRTVGRGG